MRACSLQQAHCTITSSAVFCVFLQQKTGRQHLRPTHKRQAMRRRRQQRAVKQRRLHLHQRLVNPLGRHL